MSVGTVVSGSKGVDVSEKNAQLIWKEACDHLRDLLHPDVFSRWIEEIGRAHV